MHWLTFLLVVLGGATAQGERWCSREDALSVLAAWKQGMGLGGNGDTGVVIMKATEFFIRLIKEHPSVRPLLVNVNIDDPKSPEFQAHALRVVTGLDICVNALQNYKTLESITAHLAMQHEARPGVKLEYFNSIRKFIDRNIPKLVDNIDVEAWNNCLTPIFKAITARLQ